ncbi:MAG: YbhN family protein [Ktedonobacteraceae bacterium]
MQPEQRPAQSIRRPTRLIKYSYPSTLEVKFMAPASTGATDLPDVASQPTTQIKPVNSTHLMQLSGMMRAIRIPKQLPTPQNAAVDKSAPYNSSVEDPVWGTGNGFIHHISDFIEEGYWPNGIQQTGPLPVVNLYGSEPFGRTLPTLPQASIAVRASQAKQELVWKTLFNTPTIKVTIGLLIGIGLLYLVSRFVDVPTTLGVLRQNLATPGGIILGLLSGAAFLTAFSVRGIRWKLFLNPIGNVSTFKAIQLFLIGIFLNFLLPVRGGEVAKSLILKRTAGIPVSQSLPTVAMDKALDLMPALFIMAVAPFLGVKMGTTLWLVLGAVGGLLIGLIFFVALSAWKRAAAIAFLQKMTGILPRAIGGKFEGFATGFVDSLLLGASRPKIFIPAVLLTCVAVIFDGLFAMLAFRTIGSPISFGTAIFGYTVYNMFYILPTPPGQIGSNEFVGLLVFHVLLGLPASKVTAMFVFSHPWAALLMSASGMACLSALGLTISSAMKVQTEGDALLPPLPEQQRQQCIKVL